jgi:hypothetical protein
MKRSARYMILFVVLFSAMSQGFTQTNTNGSSLFGEAAFRARVKFLSDDMLEGRGAGSRGGEIATFVGVKADPNTILKLSSGSGSESFKFADDFVAFTEAQTESVGIDADLVFVGYGIDAPERKWNDYKGSAADYKGKVLVMLVNDPPPTAEEPALFGGTTLTYYGRWTYKYEEAARRR